MYPNRSNGAAIKRFGWCVRSNLSQVDTICFRMLHIKCIRYTNREFSWISERHLSSVERIESGVFLCERCITSQSFTVAARRYAFASGYLQWLWSQRLNKHAVLFCSAYSSRWWTQALSSFAHLHHGLRKVRFYGWGKWAAYNAYCYPWDGRPYNIAVWAATPADPKRAEPVARPALKIRYPKLVAKKRAFHVWSYR